MNCLAKQKASNAAKIKRVYNSKCPKKQLTLGEIKALATKAPNDNSQNTLNNSTATVTTPNTAEYGYAHEINAIYDSIPDKNSEMDENSETDENSGNEEGIAEEKSDKNSSSKPEVWEDIYGRTRDSQGGVIQSKYVPPALRAAAKGKFPDFFF